MNLPDDWKEHNRTLTNLLWTERLLGFAAGVAGSTVFWFTLLWYFGP